jgi:hypothetical protein
MADGVGGDRTNRVTVAEILGCFEDRCSRTDSSMQSIGFQVEIYGGIISTTG